MPELSVVIPVYNEADGLESLFERLYPSLDALNRTYEIIFISDGCTDTSPSMLKNQFLLRPDVTRVILLNGNHGQHMAILAGFSYCHGRKIVTLDADLQNPPEEIQKLIQKMDEGHDYVGTIRRNRQDKSWRRIASRLMNRMRERLTKIHMTDQGCMLRAYDRAIIDAINQSSEINTFIPALAYTYAHTPTEIEVEHESRIKGESKYSLYKLIRLNFDLVTGFSVVPLQLFSFAGILISIFSAVFVLYLIWRRIFIGPEVQGVFTLFAIAFFLIGIMLFGIGLLGEYIGRIYQQVRGRPKFVIQAILESKKNET
ncbi:MAG: glycosyltransferase [Proteobacteria bacterium]|nr:glycosyltransferase [Pseudomonadota bacterium]